MVISSRTPEGDPNRCPICGYDVRLEPSWPGRDGPCPRCGHLLWFSTPATDRPSALRSVILKIVEVKFGPVPPELRESVATMSEQDLKQVADRLVAATSLAEVVEKK